MSRGSKGGGSKGGGGSRMGGRSKGGSAGWPSKNPGQPSGGGRDNAPSKK